MKSLRKFVLTSCIGAEHEKRRNDYQEWGSMNFQDRCRSFKKRARRSVLTFLFLPILYLVVKSVWQRCQSWNTTYLQYFSPKPDFLELADEHYINHGECLRSWLGFMLPDALYYFQWLQDDKQLSPSIFVSLNMKMKSKPLCKVCWPGAHDHALCRAINFGLSKRLSSKKVEDHERFGQSRSSYDVQGASLELNYKLRRFVDSFHGLWLCLIALLCPPFRNIWTLMSGTSFNGA